ncbi:MAG TPA: DUF5615 family PIN-like protein [Hyphomicrobiales bacterium]|nr:DUF5615 family PIN-like protein [Hyphomicrobiales bacterium]
MRFIVDAQLPAALARWLSSKGHEAHHVSDIGLAAGSDRAIWDAAASMNAAIITKDEDFSQRRAMVPSGPAIVWIRLPNTRRQSLLLWFETALPDILDALNRGETIVEIV